MLNITFKHDLYSLFGHIVIMCTVFDNNYDMSCCYALHALLHIHYDMLCV